MSIPPCLMRLKIINGRHHINLWLPLFLAWIILGALALALSPLVAILVLILWPFGWGKVLLMSGPTFYNGIGALREMKIDIKKSEEVVLIYFR